MSKFVRIFFIWVGTSFLVFVFLIIIMQHVPLFGGYVIGGVDLGWDILSFGLLALSV